MGASCVCFHVFMCDSQAFNSSGAKAAVKYVCGDAQIHPHLDQNPDSLDIIIIFLPSHWSSSLGALLPPPPQEMPATASVCTKTNRCSGTFETDCVSCAHRRHYNMPQNTRRHVRHQIHAKRRNWGRKTSSAAEESMASCLLVLRAVKAAACLGCHGSNAEGGGCGVVGFTAFGHANAHVSPVSL